MSREIPQVILGVPLDQTVESGMHYVVLEHSSSGSLGLRVRNSMTYEKKRLWRISKSVLLRAISRAKKDPDYVAAWRADKFRDWAIRYVQYCKENSMDPEQTPATETVKVSWFAKVGVQVKIYTDRVFPWNWFQKK